MGATNVKLPQQWVRCGHWGNISCIFLFGSKRGAAASMGGCRAASKTEYESAKRDFLLQTSFGTYARTGHWWRRYYWYCHL